ncbi:uncharacterized protein B0T15DRAFT_154132 [Chaetomium strumarium]|uniref:Uncharacterized protein n=1 Tax=Chaetomium strumarium TaxID=1170767 RepID=A0AAJ0GVC1_9PEZI|nr:hypothetical protein B0T15DRAFT_154132 [Chaetomium strumarium]
MAEPLSKAHLPGPILPPATPSSAYTPSPSTPTGRPRLSSRRTSRFTEEVMTERTPAASVSERSMDYYIYGPSAEDLNANVGNFHRCSVPNTSTTHIETEPARTNWETWLRFLNSSGHAIPCLVLLAFVSCAMRVLREHMGSYMSINAVFAICFLSFDIALDVVTLSRVSRPWPTWGLVLRLGCGIVYIVIFLVYVGLGGVFPGRYTYWGLSADNAGIMVYVLLCVEGIWNLLHVPVCRYRLGAPLLRHASPEKVCQPPPTDNRVSFNQRFSMAGTEQTEHSSISLTWRRWVRTRSTHYSREDLGCGMQRMGTREPSVDLTLREQPGEEEDEPGSSRTTSSHEGTAQRRSGLKGNEGRREDKSEGKVYPDRSVDIGQ